MKDHCIYVHQQSFSAPIVQRFHHEWITTNYDVSQSTMSVHGAMSTYDDKDVSNLEDQPKNYTWIQKH